MRAYAGGLSLSVAGDKLLADSRELVAKVIDENVEFTEIVIDAASSLHAVSTLVLQQDLA